MIFIVGLALFIICFSFPVIRCAIFHPISLCYYSFRDGVKYIQHKEWNMASYGQITCYVADSSTSFGCGKTLSATDCIVGLYRRFHGRLVWDPERQKLVRQQIKIISNVDFLTIPFERLVSLAQFVGFTDKIHDIDMENNTLTVTYMLIDEASSQLNSRKFKDNFDPYFISRLLTSRHVKASIILTSQRPGMVDKLMRDCTHLYVGCHKIWRFQCLSYYDAYDVENAGSTALCRPLRRSCWFVKDSAFLNYDTFASVQALKKSCQKGDMLSEQEIIALQSTPDSNMDSVARPSRRWLRRRKNVK